MHIEENKKRVREFFAALSRGDLQTVLDAYADDGVCWTAGSLPISGTRTKSELAPFMEGVIGAFPDGIRFTITGLVAEGERVAVEATSDGSHASGHDYHNEYHFLFRFREGKIVEFKEYLDTKLAWEVLLGGAT